LSVLSRLRSQPSRSTTAELCPDTALRVLLICDWFFAYCAAQAVGLSTSGASVMVVCRDHLAEFAGSRAEWDHHLARMIDAGVAVSVVRGRVRSRSALYSGVRAWSAARRWRPDIAHAHPNHDPWLLLVSGNSPLVVTVHDAVPHPGQPMLGMFKAALDRLWLRRADGIVVHGEQIEAVCRARGLDVPIAVIPHGTELAAAPDPVPRNRDVLFFGRLEPYKGIGVLVEAMEEVWRVYPAVRLTVAGRGPAATEVPDGDPRIRRIAGYVSDEDRDRLFAEATLLVAPYLEASQSGVVSLAVARGIPAVVSDAGALPDLAVDPSLVVPVGDARALANAVITTLEHGETLRRRVYDMASERLSWPVVSGLTLAFYRRLRAS